MSKIHDLMRAGSVKRFHIVNTTRTQTLAEHQYGVAILTGEIAARLGLEPAAVASLVAAAIVHDSGETRTGDIPTPTKRRLREALGAPFDKVIDQFDVPITVGVAHKHIMKCADFLESMVFLMEHKVGRHADIVMDEIMNDAFEYFSKCDRIGRVANQVWSDIQHAVYEI